MLPRLVWFFIAAGAVTAHQGLQLLNDEISTLPMTNMERLQRGLPPKPPMRRWDSTKTRVHRARASVVPGGPFSCVGGSVYTVAHPDDDLLFQSPTLLHEIHSDLCITTVYFSAGDNGTGVAYAQDRAAGNVAAYAQMAGVANSYTDTYATFGGQSVLVRTLTAAPQIQKVFFMLPDGNLDGSGFAAHGYQSLMKLYFGEIDSITSIDGGATFTLSTLDDAIAEIFATRAPDTIRTQDYLRDFDGSDHADHLAVARITAQLAGTTALVGYMDYPTQDLPPTLLDTSVDYQQKAAAFFTYTPYDSFVCQSISTCAGSYYGNYAAWLQREYTV